MIFVRLVNTRYHRMPSLARTTPSVTIGSHLTSLRHGAAPTRRSLAHGRRHDIMLYVDLGEDGAGRLTRDP
jgi:hypothetical protein